MQTNENTFINATLSALKFILSGGCVYDGNVNANALINPTKMRHRYRLFFHQQTVVSGIYALHVCQYSDFASAVINTVQVGCSVVPAGGATLTIDVQLASSVVQASGSTSGTPSTTGFTPTSVTGTIPVAGSMVISGQLVPFIYSGVAFTFPIAMGSPPSGAWNVYGYSLLGGPIGLTSTLTVRQLSNLGITPQTPMTQNQWIDLVIVVGGSGTAPQGLYVCAEVDEYPT